MPGREDAKIPSTLYDASTKTSYKPGKLFGKGGFAMCYEITNLRNKRLYAGKVVSKDMLVKENQREKIVQEIQIHRSLSHPNIVGFNGYFEDSQNIYIILELCVNRSMMELHRRRKTLSEYETRYYMRQILSGVQYLHEHKIIHRDLKLGNIFLQEGLQIKIGDFGLATCIQTEGERKKTLCGTPNYIAPEILNKIGHSFEVDIWSIGCIMYTLLCGKPPFETESLKETYTKIKRCDYNITKDISQDAKKMIAGMLQPKPEARPTIIQLLNCSFIKNGFCPTSLPTSALTMEPRFDQQLLMAQMRSPLREMVPAQQTGNQAHQSSIAASGSSHGQFDAKESLHNLKTLLAEVLRSKPSRKNKVVSDEMADPSAQPVIWVSKWVDYSDKYGFGYQLSDESIGVMFNDTTKIILLPNSLDVHYIDRKGKEEYMTMEEYPASQEKKIKLLTYFGRYMREHLLKTGADEVIESDTMSRPPHLHQWCRSNSGVVMQLTNGTLQFNFADHTKIILCPLMAAITYIDDEKCFRTFRFTTIKENGCTEALYEKMKYAYDKINHLVHN